MGHGPIEVIDPPSLGKMGQFLNRRKEIFLDPLPPPLKEYIKRYGVIPVLCIVEMHEILQVPYIPYIS